MSLSLSPPPSNAGRTTTSQRREERAAMAAKIQIFREEHIIDEVEFIRL